MVPGGAAYPWGGCQGGHQANTVQDGGQLPDDWGAGQGWAIGRHGQVPRLLPALGLVAGRIDSLVVAAAMLAEVVQEGEVVGLLQVGLYASKLVPLPEVREGSGEGRRPGVDSETMTCC